MMQDDETVEYNKFMSVYVHVFTLLGLFIKSQCKKDKK